jgi:hypothetical protein
LSTTHLAPFPLKVGGGRDSAPSQSEFTLIYICCSQLAILRVAACQNTMSLSCYMSANRFTNRSASLVVSPDLRLGYFGVLGR